MSHKAVIFSPPGTPILDRTVGELVAERPGRSRVFQNFKIDFCCQGARTLREACEGKGVASQSVVEQLEAEQAAPSAPAENPAEFAPDELTVYIVEKHHGFLRRELPRLRTMAARVAQVHGGHTPSLIEIFHVFNDIDQELASHMFKEEQILFPAIVALIRKEAVPMPLDGPISVMLHEHDQVGRGLERIRELSHDYQPPMDACNTYRALFAGLHDLEEDLHTHIHLENAVLFPAAEALTNALN